MRYQFATVELRWLERGGTVQDLPALLEREGLYRAVQEVFWIVTYGAKSDTPHGEPDLHAVIEVARGDFYSVNVHIPVILQAVWASGTDRFWLMHNHPSGVVKPTDKDIEMSKAIMLAANLAHLYLEDHVIIGPPRKVYSMKEHGQLTPARKIRQLTAANTPVWTHKEPE